MKLILPLTVTFPLKTKKDRVVKYSLNEFLVDLSDTSWGNKRKPNHAYQRKAKKHMQELVAEQLAVQPELIEPWPKKIQLTVYRDSNRRMDIDNTSIIVKFAMDVVKIEHCPEDDWRYFSEVTLKDGGLDKLNPRAELEILEILEIL